jgi:hypothetical protein
VPWIAWAPVGDVVGLFRAHGKNEDADSAERLDEKDRGPLRPADRGRAGIAGLQSGREDRRVLSLASAISDIYALDITTGNLTNLTKDNFGDFSPTFAPDGKTDRLHGAHQRQRQAVSSSTSRPARRSN